MLLVAVDGNRPVRRRYTIRDLDTTRQLLTLDIVRHGDGPGERWVRSAQPGDTIEGIAPRGKVFLDSRGGLAPVRRGRVRAGRGVRDGRLAAGGAAARPRSWRSRSPPTSSSRTSRPGLSLTLAAPRRPARRATRSALAAALQQAELPAGTGHFYLFGEARMVLALREMLAARGVPGEQVSAKAYWGRGKANAQHGEPARDG